MKPVRHIGFKAAKAAKRRNPRLAKVKGSKRAKIAAIRSAQQKNGSGY